MLQYFGQAREALTKLGYTLELGWRMYNKKVASTKALVSNSKTCGGIKRKTFDLL